MQQKSLRLLSLAGAILILSSLACSLVSPTPASWAGTPSAEARAATNTAYAATQQAAPTQPTPIPPTPTPEIARTPPTPSPTTPPDGPWLVYPAPDAAGLHAFDVEAGTIRLIPLPPPILWQDLHTGLAPDGRSLYLRAGSPNNTDELAIYRVDLPAGEVAKLTPLLSIVLQRRIVNAQGTRAGQALDAVTAPQSLAWSPNGRFLAFLAALDSDSSDVYLFDTLKERFERLTGLYSQSATPVWAPQSNWLVHQEIIPDAAGEDVRVESVQVIRVPGYDDQRALYLPSTESQQEIFLGWVNAQSFISYSRTPDFPRTLRLVNVETGETSLILPGEFTGAAFDPKSRTLALSLQENQAPPAEGLIAGVYRLPPDRAALTLQRAGIWQGLTWAPGGLFLAEGPQGALAFSPEGDSLLLAEEEYLRLSPNGSWLLGWGEGQTTPTGLRLYQTSGGTFMQTITDQPVETLFWQPDSLAFFLLSEGILYQVRFPGLKLEQIESGFSPEGALPFIWVDA